MKSLKVHITLLCFLSVFFAQAQKPKVVATTTILYDMARSIAGDEAEVISFLPIGGDPHIYDPRPGDIDVLLHADLIIKNGLHLEGWLDKILITSGAKAPIITATAGVVPIVSAEYHGSPDPHAWMTAPNGILMVKNITDALAQLIPEKALLFRKNFDQYKSKLEETDRYIFDKINSIPEEKRILVTTHDAFRYYANRYGLKVESVIGISTDAEIQSSDMEHVVEIIKSAGLPAIFVESTINPKLFQQIARDMNVRIGGELFADSVGDEESGASTYIDMLVQNTDLIVLGLTGQSAGIFTSETNYRFIYYVLLFFAATFLFVAWRLRIRSSDLKNTALQIDISNLNMSYDKKTVLSNINLQINSGHVVGVIGPNGSGKSTLFKAILGLVNPDSGKITINNKAVTDFTRYTAYIPQKEEIDFNFPATVMDVVLNGRYPHKKVFSRLSARDKKIAREALEQVNMIEYGNRQIGQLSGGQQQRVFLARAIAQQASIFLMDEPFVGVDITTEEKMIKILKQLASEGKIILVIHHDLSDVEEYFDEVIMLNQTLIAAGKTEEVFNDESIRAAYHGRKTVLHEADIFIH